jgi:hypothetical protein
MVAFYLMQNDLTTNTLVTAFTQLFDQALRQPNDVYTQLNSLRDGFNQLGSRFDLYLEDNWNDPIPGQTHFEYRLRSLDTKDDLGPLGIDVYTNHQDANGVWHLGDYQSSFWCLQPETNTNNQLTVLSHPGYATLPLQRVLAFLLTHRVESTRAIPG